MQTRLTYLLTVLAVLLGFVFPNATPAIAASTPQPVQAALQSLTAPQSIQGIDEGGEYWAVPLVLPVESSQVSAASALTYLPAYLKFYNGNKRLVVELLCGDTPVSGTVQIQTSLVSAVVPITNCTGTKTAWERRDAFVGGETITVSVDSGSLKTVVKLTTGSASPTWVVAYTGLPFCFALKGHYDPHVFAYLSNPQTGEITDELYREIKEEDWSWELGGPADTNLRTYNIRVLVTKQMEVVNGKPSPKGEVRADYLFLDVPNECFKEIPGLDLEKLINGNDADDENGSDVPVAQAGEIMNYQFKVTNTGNIALNFSDITLTDDTGLQPVLDSTSDAGGDNILSINETWIYRASAPALDLETVMYGHSVVPGCDPNNQGETRKTHRNLATATARGISDQDPAHFCNPVNPGLAMQKLVNGSDADEPNGADVPQIWPGGTVSYTIVVTNVGNIALRADEIAVTDDTGNVPVLDPASDDGNNILTVGEVWRYTFTVLAQNLSSLSYSEHIVAGCDPKNDYGMRQTHKNIATATTRQIVVQDPAHYCNPAAPLIDVEKLINNQDADDPNGDDVPGVEAGDTMTVTFNVSNPGNIAFAREEVVLTDDQEGVVPNWIASSDAGADDILSPGETWQYTAQVAALNLLTTTRVTELVPGCDPDGLAISRPAHRDIATVVARNVSDSDPAHYCNPAHPSITTSAVMTYTIANNGNVDLTGAHIKEVIVTCPQESKDLAIGAEIQGNCTVTIVAEAAYGTQITTASFTTGEEPVTTVTEPAQVNRPQTERFLYLPLLQR